MPAHACANSRQIEQQGKWLWWTKRYPKLKGGREGQRMSRAGQSFLPGWVKLWVEFGLSETLGALRSCLGGV